MLPLIFSSSANMLGGRSGKGGRELTKNVTDANSTKPEHLFDVLSSLSRRNLPNHFLKENRENKTIYCSDAITRFIGQHMIILFGVFGITKPHEIYLLLLCI